MRRLLLAASIALISLAGGAEAEDCPKCASTVSMELREADIRVFLEGTAKAYGINMVIADGVSGSVSASLNNTPLINALDTVLESKGFARRSRGSLMIIEPGGPGLEAERGLMTAEIKLLYTKADTALLDALKSVMSATGKASLLPNSNTIVLKDIPIGLERAKALAASIDRRPGQVLVEARIVEVKREAGKTLGLNWGGRYHRTSGNVFGGLGSVDGDFAVNLPGAEEAAGTFGVAVVSDRVSLDLRITALETSGEARTVSTPSVSVRENHRAVIAEGTRILIPDNKTTISTVIATEADKQAAKEKSEVATFDAFMELSVVPRIAHEESIALAVEIRREWFDYTTKVEGFPPKLTKSASTEIVLKSGESIAIGGITVEADEKSKRQVPVLGKIPILGALFRGTSSAQEMRELLIILTPKVIQNNTDSRDVDNKAIEDSKDEGDSKNPQE